MDSLTQKSCMEEISHRICDCDKKVNLNDISNDWNLTYQQSEEMLLAWLDAHQDRSVAKEYIVRVVDKHEHCHISVVAESRLAALEKRFTKFFSSLYSVEIASDAPSIYTAPLSTTHNIRLPLTADPRICDVAPISIPESKPNVAQAAKSAPKKPESTLFAAIAQPKEEKKEVAVKAEPTETPKKPSPKKDSPKKKGAAAKTPAAATGRSAISSFFSKPSTTKSSNEIKVEPATTSRQQQNTEPKSNGKSARSPGGEDVNEIPAKRIKVDVVVDKAKKADTKLKNHSVDDDDDDDDEMIEGTPPPQQKQKGNNSKSSKAAHKSKLIDTDDDDDEVIAESPQEKKKPQRKQKESNGGGGGKHSRIRQIVDSSDEEDAVAVKPEPDPTIKEKENKTPPNLNGRRKAKRTVTRTYEDENGYLVTAKEIEEYSCSDEDDRPVVVTAAATVAKVAPSKAESSVEEGSSKPTKKAKKVSPPAKTGTKQGSILSFFSKK